MDDEFDQVYSRTQPKKFRIVSSTPILSELEDGEVVLFSTSPAKIMWRNGIEIFAVTGSCITVRR